MLVLGCNHPPARSFRAFGGRDVIEGDGVDVTQSGPGGDPIRNPDVLPTGKNMHALDPNSIPTKVGTLRDDELGEKCCAGSLQYCLL